MDGLTSRGPMDEEMWALGALISDPQCRDDGFSQLEREYFEKPENLYVFDLVCELFVEGKDFDWGIIVKEFEKRKTINNIGGPAYILQLVKSCPVTNHVTAYAERLKERSIERKLQIFKEQRIDAILSENSNVNSKWTKMLFELESIGNISVDNSLVKADQGIKKALEDIKMNSKQDLHQIGVPLGFKALDNVVKFLRPGDMVILAARPSMGKTTMACNTITNLVLNQNLNKNRKRTVAFFSLEMNTISLFQRLIASHAGISFNELIAGNLTNSQWVRVSTVIDQFRDSSLYIDDKARDINKIAAKAKRLKNTVGLDLIVMDYFQLAEISGVNPRMSRQERMTEVSQKCKAVATDLGVPIIVLSQLNRDVDKRHDKRPVLSDLRDTGSLEQDADVVIFLLRPWVYVKDSKKEPPERTIVEIAKQRNGEVAITEMKFLGHAMRFEDQ